MSNILLPGGLNRLLRPEQAGHDLDEAIFYRKFLEMTRTYLNTQSLILF